MRDVGMRSRQVGTAAALVVMCLLSGCSAGQSANSSTVSAGGTSAAPMPTETLQPEVLRLVVCNAVSSAEADGVTHRVEVVVTTAQRINALGLPNYAGATSPSPPALSFPDGTSLVMAVSRGVYHSGMVTSGGASAGAFPPANYDAIMTFHGLDGTPMTQTGDVLLDQPVVPAPDLSSLGSVQDVPVTSQAEACKGIG